LLEIGKLVLFLCSVFALSLSVELSWAVHHSDPGWFQTQLTEPELSKPSGNHSGDSNWRLAQVAILKLGYNPQQT
jgi:hypothetical protein